MSSVNTTSLNANESTSQQNCDFTDSAAEKICKTLAQVVVMLTSLVGNSLIIIIVYRHKELRRTINYFIVNMAISDLVLCLAHNSVSVTWTVFGDERWLVGGTLGLILCKLVFFLFSVSVTVSVQSLFWIAVDRFIAVVFPMKVRLISSKVRLTLLASTWILACAVVFPIVFTTKLVEQQKSTTCETDSYHGFFSERLMTTYYQIVASIFFVLPLCVMTGIYSAIAVTLRRQSKIITGVSTNIQRHDDRKNRAVKMSFCIMVAFYICYLPQLGLLVMRSETKLILCSLRKTILFIAVFAFYLSTTINPIICFTFVGSYRRGLKQMLHSCRFKKVKLNREIIKQDQITLKEIRKTDKKD